VMLIDGFTYRQAPSDQDWVQLAVYIACNISS